MNRKLISVAVLALAGCVAVIAQEKKKQEEKTKKEILNRKKEALQLEAETLIVQRAYF